MRRGTTYLMAAALAVAGLSSGCSLSSMEKKYDDLRGRSDKKETRVELNNARRKQLAALPGLTADDADRIIANRPYENRRDLMRKNVLSEGKFEKVKDSVYVEHGNE
jgi:DNA uptake protein ComE-like DNA-binding protein